MRKKTWAWAAGAVLVLCGAALAAALLTPRAIDVPYEYPIVPGTDEWFAMSGRERKKACQIPEDVLERLTDEALARSVLDYPFLMDMTLYSTPEGDWRRRAASSTGWTSCWPAPVALRRWPRRQSRPRERICPICMPWWWT